MISSVVFMLALIGLLLVIQNFKQKKIVFWVGLLLLVGGICYFGYSSTREITKDVIGAEVLHNEKNNFELAFRYYELKTDALKYYQDRNIKLFFIFAKFEGPSREFYETVLPGGKRAEKRIRFEGDQKRSGFELFNGFLEKNILMPVYSSPALIASFKKEKK